MNMSFRTLEPGDVLDIKDQLISVDPGTVLFEIESPDGHGVRAIYTPEEIEKIAGGLYTVARSARRSRRRARRRGWLG
jgi:hypothetical protein